NSLAQFGFRVGLQLLQDHRRNFGWTVFASTKHHPRITIRGPRDLVGNALYCTLYLGIVIFATHEALNRKDGILWVGHGLPFGNLADQPLTTLRDRNDRGSQPRSFAVFQNSRLTGLHDGHDRVRRSEVNTYYFSHYFISLK